MSDFYGLKIRNPETGAAIFNSYEDEVLYFYKELHVGIEGGTWKFPELKGKRIYVHIVYMSDYSNPENLDGNARLSTSVTYPNGIPTFKTYHHFNGTSPDQENNALGTLRTVLILTDGTGDYRGGKYGVRFQNKNGRVTVTNDADPYVLVGTDTLAGLDDGFVRAKYSFKCKGTPIVFLECPESPVGFSAFYLDSDGISWQSHLYGLKSKPIKMLVFGRASLNIPDTENKYGFRLRSLDGQKIVFDSGFKMLALSKYSADEIFDFRYTDRSFNLGLDNRFTAIAGMPHNSFVETAYRKISGSGLNASYQITTARSSFSLTKDTNNLNNYLWRGLLNYRQTVLQFLPDEGNWSDSFQTPSNLDNTMANLMFVDIRKYI
jgi:hypothetical protein